MTFSEIRESYEKNVMPTYARCPVALVSGKGATAKDEAGREYIDFTSGIGVNCLGYADENWAAAVAKQASTLQHISNLYYSPVQAELAEKLCGLSGMSKVFFCNSGAEANECAIKLARRYGAEKLGPGRTGIVTLKNSFHGRTWPLWPRRGRRGSTLRFFRSPPVLRMRKRRWPAWSAAWAKPPARFCSS